MPPQNLTQVQVLPAMPLAPHSLSPVQKQDHHPPPAELTASQLFQREPTVAAVQEEQSFVQPAPQELAPQRGGIAPHAVDYHLPRSPTKRLMQRTVTQTEAEPQMVADPQTEAETWAEAEILAEQPSSNSLAITGLVLAFIFAPLGLIVSIRALAKRKTHKAKLISTAGIGLSSLGIALMVMFTLAVAGSFATVRGHNTDMQQQASLETVQNRLQSAFIEKGTYPSLAQLNSSSWRAKNLTGTDASLLSPSVKPTALVSGKATDDSFAYNVVPASCAGTRHSPCKSFTLAAAMSTGEEYSVQ